MSLISVRIRFKAIIISVRGRLAFRSLDITFPTYITTQESNFLLWTDFEILGTKTLRRVEHTHLRSKVTAN